MDGLKGILVIGLGFFLGLLLYKWTQKAFAAVMPFQEPQFGRVIYRSGDPVTDFLDNY